MVGHNDQVTQVWRSLADVPRDLGPAVVTVGNFDGVHRGHQAVLSAVVAEARSRGAKAIAVTFFPHPKAVHDPEHQPELITGINDRVSRMAATGLDGIIVQEYTIEFAQSTAEEFVRDYIRDGLNACAVVVGRDTRFGRGNAGDVETLKDLGERLGLDVEIVSDAAAGSEGARRWSSTWVRELLDAGDLEGATEILGRYHRLRGTVVHGDKLGREIGFPTANLDVSAGFIPRHGVYAAWLEVVDTQGNDRAARWIGTRLPAAVSLGINYTVGGSDLRVEAHVIDHQSLDLYDATVALDLVRWRRPMLDFGGIEALIEALGDDVTWCRDVLYA
jgi:riboflavin kinase/FMN adenylyltransferase